MLFSENYEARTRHINCDRLSDTREPHTTRLINLLETCQLSQFIKEPTRVRENSSTLIDLFIANNPESIEHSGVYPLCISDNYVTYVETRNSKLLNANSFISDLTNASWPQTDNSMNINESWENRKRGFLHIFDKHAPKRVIRVRNKPAPWLDSNLKQQMMTRYSLKRRAIKMGSENDWNCYRNMRNKVNYAVKCAKSNYYRKKLQDNLGDPKKTWKVLNDVMGKKSAVTEISELVTSSSENGLSNAKDIADHFNINILR